MQSSACGPVNGSCDLAGDGRVGFWSDGAWRATWNPGWRGSPSGLGPPWAWGAASLALDASGLDQDRQDKGLRVGGMVGISLPEQHRAGGSHRRSHKSPCSHPQSGHSITSPFAEWEAEVLVPQLVSDQSRVKIMAKVTTVTAVSLAHTICLATRCTLYIRYL